MLRLLIFALLRKICPKCAKTSTRFTRKNNCAKIILMREQFTSGLPDSELCLIYDITLCEGDCWFLLNSSKHLTVRYLGCDRIPGFSSAHNLLDLEKFFINYPICTWFCKQKVSRFTIFVTIKYRQNRKNALVLYPSRLLC